MSELTLLLLRIGFLVLLWFFVLGVVYALRADLFGNRPRKLPAGAAPAAALAPVATTPRARSSSGGSANIRTVTRLVITSGPKTGTEIPLQGLEVLTIGRSSESGLVIRDDYTSSHHARLVLKGDQWIVQDLDSTNGTSVDGERIRGTQQLSVGVPVTVGATSFELRA